MLKTTTRKVTLKGLSPIMFDRYPGDNKTQLPPEQKMYYEPGTNKLVIPSINIMSFLSAEGTKSAAKTFYDSREYKKVAQYLRGFVSIEPFLIPLTRDNKQIEFESFGTNKIDCRKDKPMVKGIPFPTTRPYIDLPWQVQFSLHLIENEMVNDADIRLLFDKGGLAVGLGAYRPVFGKFYVDGWE